jgi:hypothetical protein
MHKNEKTEYKRNGISIKLTVEKEGIKVRVKAESGTADEPTEMPDQEQVEVEADEIEEVAS